MFMKLIQKNWKVISVIFILLCSVLYFYFLVGVQTYCGDNYLNFLSILSSFSSIVGILIALWQIGKISDDLEQFKNKQNISRIATMIEKIDNAKKFLLINNNKETFKLGEEIKKLILLSKNELGLNDFNCMKEKISFINKILIKSGTSKILDDYKNKILDNFEEINELLINYS